MLYKKYTTKYVLVQIAFYCLHCSVLNACLLFLLKLCSIMKSVTPVDASLVSNYVRNVALYYK